MLGAAGFVSMQTLNYARNKRTHSPNTIVADMRALKPLARAMGRWEPDVNMNAGKKLG